MAHTKQSTRSHREKVNSFPTSAVQAPTPNSQEDRDSPSAVGPYLSLIAWGLGFLLLTVMLLMDTLLGALRWR
jgi:hypothetical protein